MGVPAYGNLVGDSLLRHNSLRILLVLLLEDCFGPCVILLLRGILFRSVENVIIIRDKTKKLLLYFPEKPSRVPVPYAPALYIVLPYGIFYTKF